MDRFIATSSHKRSLLSTHKVLRNTYFLLSLTLAFSALTATLTTVLRLPTPNAFFVLIGFYGLLFLTHRLSNKPTGILATFALTGFMGYTLGPILNVVLSSGSGDIIILAFCGTALVFLCCSAYVLTFRKDMSFLSSMLLAGSVVLLFAVIINFFLNITALSLSISIMFILFSSGAILWETSNILNNGENNYIRATVNIYVSLYNIFVSLLSFFIGIRNNN